MKQLIIILLTISSAVAAQNMDELFIRMPDELIPQLEEAWRKDLVELYKSGKTAALENTMQGQSKLHQLTDDYLRLQTTESSFIELKLLPLVNNTRIICMVTTVMAPAPDSRVEFYATEWLRLPSDGLFTPADESVFLNGNPRISAPCLIKYTLNAANTTLAAEYATTQYLDDEARTEIAPFLKNEPKIYVWRLNRFE